MKTILWSLIVVKNAQILIVSGIDLTIANEEDVVSVLMISDEDITLKIDEKEYQLEKNSDSEKLLTILKKLDRVAVSSTDTRMNEMDFWSSIKIK